MSKERTRDEILQEVELSRANIANAEQGLERLKSEIPACIVAAGVSAIVAYFWFPVLWAVTALAAGNAIGKQIFLKKAFKRIIDREAKVVSRCNTYLRLHAIRSREFREETE